MIFSLKSTLCWMMNNNTIIYACSQQHPRSKVVQFNLYVFTSLCHHDIIWATWGYKDVLDMKFGIVCNLESKFIWNESHVMVDGFSLTYEHVSRFKHYDCSAHEVFPRLIQRCSFLPKSKNLGDMSSSTSSTSLWDSNSLEMGYIVYSI